MARCARERAARYLILGVLAAAAPSVAASIWTEYRTTGGTKDWISVAMSADGTQQTAVVDGGNIWTSGDSGGTTWIEDTSVGDSTDL